MTKFDYDFSIKAKDSAEATRKIRALAVLGEELTAAELHKLADVVKNSPVQKALAKKFLGV